MQEFQPIISSDDTSSTSIPSYSFTAFAQVAEQTNAEPSWGFYTKTSGKLYVHVLK